MSSNPKFPGTKSGVYPDSAPGHHSGVHNRGNVQNTFIRKKWERAASSTLRPSFTASPVQDHPPEQNPVRSYGLTFTVISTPPWKLVSCYSQTILPLLWLLGSLQRLCATNTFTIDRINKSAGSVSVGLGTPSYTWLRIQNSRQLVVCRLRYGQKRQQRP